MSTDAADDTATPLSDAPDALAELARRDRFFDALSASLAEQRCVKLVLGKPRRGGSDLVRVTARPLVRSEEHTSELQSH